MTFAANEPYTIQLPAQKSALAALSKNGIVCLLDNKTVKDLKRHLLVFHNLTVEEYKARFNLPNDTPISVFPGVKHTSPESRASRLRAA